MQDLIKVINRVQDVFGRVNIPVSLDLPRIAVIGSQSSGKSSVLESIVGKDFLPRGTGMVTRCPIILQLQNIKDGDDYAVFNHKDKVFMKNFEDVRNEIVAETTRTAGNNRSVTSTPIILKIFSKSVLNLTLVDLPGLIKVPDKDQPENTADVIRETVTNEIKGQNCLILAVSPGNFDLANSDALNLAKIVDPDGNRTIGVITKLDIMDKGTDAMDIFDGRVYPLKLGYIGVVCRSAKDLIDNKGLPEALKSEHEFFEKTRAYSTIRDRCGIKYLQERLSKLLMNHVKNCLPELKKSIEKNVKERKEELSTYGLEYHGNRHTFLTSAFTEFSEYYHSAFDGIASGDLENELQKGARVRYIIHKAFPDELIKIKALDGLNDDRIRTTIENTKALRFCLFVPDVAFERLIKHQILRLLEPSLKCLYMVYDELAKIVKVPDIPKLRGYYKLKQKIVEIITGLLNRCLKETEGNINKIIEAECAYCHTEDSGIISFEDLIFGTISEELEKCVKEESEKLVIRIDPNKAQAINYTDVICSSVQKVLGKLKEEKKKEEIKKEEKKKEEKKNERMEDVKDEQAKRNEKDVLKPGLDNPLPKVMKADFATSKKEEIKLKAIKKLLESYFEGVKKRIIDTVPKNIITFFVEKTRTSIMNELTEVLFGDENVEALIGEDAEIARRRKECQNMLSALEESQKAIHEISYIE